MLATAAGMLAAGSIDNIILEYSPGVYERANRHVSMQLCNCYSIYVLCRFGLHVLEAAACTA